MNVVEKRFCTDGEPYYFNIETEERYGEIVGGLAWPDMEDAFLVIAAVDWFENREPEGRHIRVLAVTRESNIYVLLRHAIELQKQFSPFTETIRFYGDTASPAMMEFLSDFNWDRRYQGLDPFYLTEAPQSKDPQKLEFYARLIRTYTRSGRKNLHFCDTLLPRYLMGHSLDEIDKNVLAHPPMAALGYALAVLSTWRSRRGESSGERRDRDKNQLYNEIRL
jgi:hypothetical protein